MAGKDLHKKLKKIKNANLENHANEENSTKLVKTEKTLSEDKDEKIKKKSLAQKRKIREKLHNDASSRNRDESDSSGRKKKSKMSKNRKKKMAGTVTSQPDMPCTGTVDGSDEQNPSGNEVEEIKKSKSRKRRSPPEKDAGVSDPYKPYSNAGSTDGKEVDVQNTRTHPKSQGQVESLEQLDETDRGTSLRTGKSKSARKIKRKSSALPKQREKLIENRGPEEDEVYLISSGDEDCSKGMRKWIMEYRQSRPGLKVLQERIDDFITAHEAQEEQARKEREAQAAEGGWTVVVHHKGRKKTTDAESGIAVGSVAQAAVLDKMSKKKNKEVGLDFYRFQKREAQRNEIMLLQSKFEQDKKRIQQMRAARKFRPY